MDPYLDNNSSRKLPLGLLAAMLLLFASGMIMFGVERISRRAKLVSLGWMPPNGEEARARSQGRHIVYWFSADWCEPCRAMERNTLADKRVISAIAGGCLLILVKDVKHEEGRNPPSIERLQRRYNVNAFPTFVIAQYTGEEIARLEGYKTPEEFTTFIRLAFRKRNRMPPAIVPEPPNDRKHTPR